jgi:4-phospho-D-threonate 3-dehydrogenase / 4-phospho-D-erythronate 3-dehydrogenase
MKPLLGITMGDPAGIGPEVVVKALVNPEIQALCNPVVIGDTSALQQSIHIAGLSLRLETIRHPCESRSAPGIIQVIDLGNVPADLPIGTVDPRAGKAAYENVARAVEYAMAGEIQGIVTAPLNKEALNLAGYRFPGHTEILAHLSGVQHYSMMLVGPTLRVVHVTTHVSLRRACDLIRKDRVMRVIHLAEAALKQMGIARPRIGVAGLNPHAGENGLLGDEDAAEIEPAIAEARAAGLNVTGPLPADTIFHRAVSRGEFDIVVVMYHDQGHIPLKTLDFQGGVNVTVGLPFIRTSVDHGTAFDIAGKGKADPRSMREALLLAAKMAKQSHPANGTCGFRDSLPD